MERDVSMQLATQIAALEATVESGFAETHRRLDEHGRKLASIEAEAKYTNGRVTRLEERMPRDAVTVSALKLIKEFGGWALAGLFTLLKLTGAL